MFKIIESVAFWLQFMLGVGWTWVHFVDWSPHRWTWRMEPTSHWSNWTVDVKNHLKVFEYLTNSISVCSFAWGACSLLFCMAALQIATLMSTIMSSKILWHLLRSVSVCMCSRCIEFPAVLYTCFCFHLPWV